MKVTTTLKVGKNQILRPSGVIASKDGKYFYWSCSVSGTKTFANAERFKTILERYGNDEKRLVKEFICRPAQKLIDAGIKDPVELSRQLNNPAAKKEAKANRVIKKQREKIVKIKRKKSLKAFAVGEVEVKEQTATGSVEVKAEKIYPWTGNPDYFKSTAPSVYSIEETTATTCVYPNFNLNDECRGCPIYDRCKLETKYTENDWKKPARNKDPKVTKINSFSV